MPAHVSTLSAMYVLACVFYLISCSFMLVLRQSCINLSLFHVTVTLYTLYYIISREVHSIGLKTGARKNSPKDQQADGATVVVLGE